jgi:hypothetical protein
VNNMNFGNTIVGGEGQVTRKRTASKLLSKYKVGGKVTDKKGAIAEALKHKRERLREKYADGGAVAPGATKPVSAPYKGSSWWAQLQQEIANMTPVSPLGSTSVNQMSPSQPGVVPQQGMQGNQQMQPSKGMYRGGKVR